MAKLPKLGNGKRFTKLEAKVKKQYKAAKTASPKMMMKMGKMPKMG